MNFQRYPKWSLQLAVSSALCVKVLCSYDCACVLTIMLECVELESAIGGVLLVDVLVSVASCGHLGGIHLFMLDDADERDRRYPNCSLQIAVNSAL